MLVWWRRGRNQQMIRDKALQNWAVPISVAWPQPPTYVLFSISNELPVFPKPVIAVMKHCFHTQNSSGIQRCDFFQLSLCPHLNTLLLKLWTCLVPLILCLCEPHSSSSLFMFTFSFIYFYSCIMYWFLIYNLFLHLLILYIYFAIPHGMQDLRSLTRIKPVLPVAEAWSPNH